VRASLCIGSLALVAVVCVTSGARAFDDALYPDWKGLWERAERSTNWDPTKDRGVAQQAPLIPEYQAILEAADADQKSGGQGIDPTYSCTPAGVPRVMALREAMQVIINPQMTYLLLEHYMMFRHVHTDGRDWPDRMTPSFAGYSIGTWIDTDGDGRYDLLEIETRGFKGPRVYENSGIALHRDNQSVVKERLYLDKDDPNFMHNDITTIDNALTRPWTVYRKYHRDRNAQWLDFNCYEANRTLRIRNDFYMLNSERQLMPTRKDQPPPDLRYFEQNRSPDEAKQNPGSKSR
jgi:hypothetical protein